MKSLLSPTIYRGARGAPALVDGIYKGGGGQGEVSLPPKAPRGAFHHMDSSMVETLGAWAYRLVPLAHLGQGAPPTAHVAPQDRWPPPVVPVQYR